MAPNLKHQQLAKEKNHTKWTKNPPQRGTKPLQEGRETSTSLNYPKGSIEKEEENPFKKIKEREERKQKGKKKGGGASFFFFSSWRGREQWERDNQRVWKTIALV